MMMMMILKTAIIIIIIIIIIIMPERVFFPNVNVYDWLVGGSQVQSHLEYSQY